MEFENLTADQTRELIAKRYNEAIQSGFIPACAVVARNLGSDPAGSGFVSTYGPKFAWEKDGVKIFLDDYGGYMNAYFEDRRVLSTHEANRFIIPGDWQQVIWDALPEAEEKAKVKKAEAEKAERKRLLDKLR